MQQSDPRRPAADMAEAVRGYFVPVLELDRARVVTFAELGRAIRKHWLWIAGFALLGLACGLAAGMLMKRAYAASVVFMPVEDDPATSAISGFAGQLGGLASLAGINLQGGSRKAEFMAVLNSRGFLDRFITDEGLLPLLFPKAWDPDTKGWRDRRWRHPPTMADAVRRFERNVRTIEVDRRSDIVTITIEWPDREATARWANSMIARANRKIRENVIDESRRNIEFLEREAARTAVVGVQDSIYRLIEHEVRRSMMAHAREDYAFRVIDPAVVPAVEDYVKPDRPLLAGAGLALGLIGSLLAVTIRALFLRET